MSTPWADLDVEHTPVTAHATAPTAAVAAAIVQPQDVVDVLGSPGEQANDALHEVISFLGHHEPAAG